MSAKKLSRAFAQGEIKKLRRMKQPLVLTVSYTHLTLPTKRIV